MYIVHLKLTLSTTRAGWAVVEPVLDRHSVESEVRAYTDSRTERSMVVKKERLGKTQQTLPYAYINVCKHQLVLLPLN